MTANAKQLFVNDIVVLSANVPLRISSVDEARGTISVIADDVALKDVIRLVERPFHVGDRIDEDDCATSVPIADLQEEKHLAYELVCESDFDGYFEHWLRALIRMKLKANRLLRHNRFIVSAEAFRGQDCATEQQGDTLRLVFYSVARVDGRLRRSAAAILEEL